VSSGTKAVARRRVRVTGRALVLAALVVALAAAAVVPVRQYFEQRAEIAALEEQVDALLDQKVGLEQRIERLRDPEYLEFLARKCLGMVKKGEMAFVTVPEGGQPRPASC
jgi:cell division protein FtsB